MNYVRNAWYVAAWAHECVSERPLGTRVLNEPIVIWRSANGGLAAFEDRCVHRLAPLSLGRCEGEKLRCGYHGWLYDQTGRVVEIPGQEKAPSGLGVRVSPIIERHGWVWIWRGEAALVDERWIPPVIGLDNANFVFRHGQLDYVAEARLISDNLLDLSHVSFVHTESFKMSEVWARERPRITEFDRCVRSERWVRSEGPMGGLDAANSVDTYFWCDCFVPGVLLMSGRYYPVGTADALTGNQPPDFNSMEDGFTTQAVTPLTETTARYFFMMGWRPSHESEASIEAIMATYAQGFAEDKTIIEAQQRSIDLTPDRRFTPSSSDRAVILFNRIIEKLARKDPTRRRESGQTADSASDMEESSRTI